MKSNLWLFPRGIKREGLAGKNSLTWTSKNGSTVTAAYYIWSTDGISVARNMAQPFDTSDPTRTDISPTRWRTVCDLTNGVYYFESTTSPNIIWASLRNLNFEEGSPVKGLELVNKSERIGDVSTNFQETEPFEWVKPTPLT